MTRMTRGFWGREEKRSGDVESPTLRNRGSSFFAEKSGGSVPNGSPPGPQYVHTRNVLPSHLYVCSRPRHFSGPIENLEEREWV